MNNKIKTLVSVTALIISTASSVHAAEDSEFALLARDRQYLGGLDESDLKVQLQLIPNEKAVDTSESEEGF